MKTLLLLLLLLVAGCTSRGGWPRFLRPGEAPDGPSYSEQRQYIIHDTVQNDCWNGSGWTAVNKAKRFTYAEAWKIVNQMRRNRVGGYADSGAEEDRPIKVERIDP